MEYIQVPCVKRDFVLKKYHYFEAMRDDFINKRIVISKGYEIAK